MKKLLLSAVVLSVLGGAATNVMALEVGRNSPYDYRIKSVVYNLLMWSKLTLSPVWLPTLLSRLTKPISLMLLAILKAGRLRTK